MAALITAGVALALAGPSQALAAGFPPNPDTSEAYLSRSVRGTSGSASSPANIMFDDSDDGPRSGRKPALLARPSAFRIAGYEGGGRGGRSVTELSALNWTAWSQTDAVADGFGTPSTRGADATPVTVRLSAPKQCGAYRIWTRVHIDWSAKADQVEDARLRCNPLVIQHPTRRYTDRDISHFRSDYAPERRSSKTYPLSFFWDSADASRAESRRGASTLSLDGQRVLCLPIGRSGCRRRDRAHMRLSRIDYCPKAKELVYMTMKLSWRTSGTIRRRTIQWDSACRNGTFPKY